MKKLNQAWLPYLAAAAQAIMFCYVGVQYFGAWGWAIGPAVGVVVNASLAIASSRISDVAQKRKGLARLMYTALLFLSPATIALSIYAPKSILTAIAWAASPDLAIALAGAIAGGSLIAKSETQKMQGETERPLKHRSAKKNKPQANIPCPHAGAGCARTGSQNAMNAHASKCKFKPTISMPIEQKAEK
ncbi:MAG TPA: hypothetical protein DCS05_03975 [Nitrospiraceae bacterium]|nr:hypothetical protein [Nitrospiraceae bacterium]